ncbi:MAG: PilX N-terminal domain-containing pilus assembly protein, partial [Gammaproteobacteria bacterium]|nr:PilX N-terminal domain-containing pilus assembly protein [Gammaproteobacteria bacterium]
MKPMTKYPLTLDKTTRLTSPSLARREDGVALAVSLVLLIVLTVLGISALTMTGQEEKMSGNFQDMTRSFQVAESGLVDAFTGQFSLTQTVLGTV